MNPSQIDVVHSRSSRFAHHVASMVVSSVSARFEKKSAYSLPGIAAGAMLWVIRWSVMNPTEARMIGRISVTCGDGSHASRPGPQYRLNSIR